MLQKYFYQPEFSATEYCQVYFLYFGCRSDKR